MSEQRFANALRAPGQGLLFARRPARRSRNRYHLRSASTRSGSCRLWGKRAVYHARFHAKGILTILGVLLCSSALVAGENEISGYARNQTSGRPAAGDEVILIRLDRGMHEESHAKVDEQGSFKVAVQYPEKRYLVRVVDDGVSYDQQARAGGSVSISVFNAITQVQGITGSIEILRTGTNGTLLHVSDMYEPWNQSNPPVTRNGARTFELYLPARAKITSVLAASSGKLISAVLEQVKL